jgi:hypothetical protein
VVTLGALLLSLSQPASATSPDGGFGFDWLRPKSATCQPIVRSLIARFRACERHDGAFGLSDPVHVCRIDERSEFMVFASRAACSRNLYAMRANAP